MRRRPGTLISINRTRERAARPHPSPHAILEAPGNRRRRRAAIVEPRLIWINSGPRAFREDFSIRGAIAMPIETAVMLFAIVIPFAIFAGVLGWAQSRTK
jgi:multisubunit Na+/H+ antiporter MnhC subunit